MAIVTTDNVELVKRFLAAQNLEHIGEIDGAIEIYETIVASSFDSSGPYDRLIALYTHQARFREVVRVCESALTNVRTYEDKRAFYDNARVEALKSAGRLPQAAPRKRR